MKKLLLLSVLALSAAQAHDNPVHLSNCAIQATIPGAKATGAFLTIHKNNDEKIELVSAAAPAITEHVEIHEMVMAEGVMKMQQIPNYPLQKGENIFKKGGYHIMLMSLDKTLEAGQTYPIQLTFSNGRTETCEAAVKSVEALTPKHMKKHMKAHSKGQHPTIQPMSVDTVKTTD